MIFYNDGDIHLFKDGANVVKAGLGQAVRGEWQDFLVRVSGDKLSLDLQGKTVLQGPASQPTPGNLAIFSYMTGATLAFKELQLRELDADGKPVSSAQPAIVPPAAKEEAPDWPQDEYKPFYQLVIRKAEDLNTYHGDYGCTIGFADAQGRACMRVPNTDGSCSFYRNMSLEATAGVRLRLHYFAHDCKEFKINFFRAGTRNKAMFSNFVNDKWTWGAVTAQQAGFDGPMEHFEVIASSNAPDAYLLVDKIVWDKK